MPQASDSMLRKYLLYRIGKIENEAGVKKISAVQDWENRK
jgi:hypothetical protein